MRTPVIFFWRISDHRDGETAKAEVGDMKLLVQDCDGDRSDWDIERGDAYLARGGDSGHEPYHFEAAKSQCELVARAILEADEVNAFLKSDSYLKGCALCGQLPEDHGKGWHSTCTSYVAPRRKVLA